MRGAHALLLPTLHFTKHTSGHLEQQIQNIFSPAATIPVLSYQPRGQIPKLLHSSSTLGFDNSQRFLRVPDLAARGRRDFVCSPHIKNLPIIPNNLIHIFAAKTPLLHSFLCITALLKSHQPKGVFSAQEVSMLPAGLGRGDVLPSRTEGQKELKCDPRRRVTKPTPTRSTLWNVLRAAGARRDRTPDVSSAHKVKHNVLATAQTRRAKCKEFSARKAAWGYRTAIGRAGTEVPRQPLCPGISPQPCPPWAPGAGGLTHRPGGERPTGPPAPALQHAGPCGKGSRIPRSTPASLSSPPAPSGASQPCCIPRALHSFTPEASPPSPHPEIPHPPRLPPP